MAEAEAACHLWYEVEQSRVCLVEEEACYSEAVAVVHYDQNSSERMAALPAPASCYRNY